MTARNPTDDPNNSAERGNNLPAHSLDLEKLQKEEMARASRMTDEVHQALGAQSQAFMDLLRGVQMRRIAESGEETQPRREVKLEWLQRQIETLEQALGIGKAPDYHPGPDVPLAPPDEVTLVPEGYIETEWETEERVHPITESDEEAEARLESRLEWLRKLLAARPSAGMSPMDD